MPRRRSSIQLAEDMGDVEDEIFREAGEGLDIWNPYEEGLEDYEEEELIRPYPPKKRRYPQPYDHWYNVGIQNKDNRHQRFRELKYSDRSLLDTFDTNGDGNYFRREYNTMEVYGGTDNDNRIGTEITLTSLDFRAYFSLDFNPGIKINATGVGQGDKLSARVRFFIYVDRDGSDGFGKALGQEGGYGTFSRSKSFLSDASFLSFYNLDTAPRYEMLHDECFEIKPDIKAKKWLVRGLLDNEVDTRSYPTTTYPALPVRTQFFNYAGVENKQWSIDIGGVKYVNIVPTANAFTTFNTAAAPGVVTYTGTGTTTGTYTGPIGGVGGGTINTVNTPPATGATLNAALGVMTGRTVVPAFHTNGGAPAEGPIWTENLARFHSHTVETNENAVTRQWTPDPCYVLKKVHINLNELISKFRDMESTVVTSHQLRWGLIVDTQVLNVNVEYNTRIRFDD